MTRALVAIAGRELGAMFRTPVGWVSCALYTLLTAVVFALQTVEPGEPASLRYFFAPSAWLLLVIAPAISMRLFAEEYRAGTAEALFSAPVSRGVALLGKYAGAVLTLACVFLPTLAFPLCLAWLADGPIDAGAIGAGYLGLLCVAMLYLAVGTLVSTTTDSQVLAFLVTLIALVLVMILAGPGAQRAPGWLGPILAQLSVPGRAGVFASGIVETRHLLFFAGTSGGCLALAFAVLSLREGR